MNKNKKLNRLFWYIFIILLMFFTTLYISFKGGYYEYSQSKKKILTEEQIKKFEKDVSLGKDVDISDYLVVKEDFQSKNKRIGLKISEFIGTCTKHGVDKLFKMLNNLVES